MTRENTADGREGTGTRPLAPEVSVGAPRKSGAASARVDPMIGRRLGSYEILARVARGGMGVVYRARHVYIDKIVAIKILDPELAGRHDLIERFRTEAQSLARVEHENVIKVIDIIEDHGVHGIVMDFAEGDNLRVQVKDRGPLQPEELLSVARQTAEALYAAHREGILHRDIKPENLIRNARGRCKLADFGLAGDLRLIAEGHEGPINFGTPAYSSPEVLRRIVPDKRSDIFSYGATLYHLATGEPPFGASGMQQIMLRQKQGAVLLEARRTDLPPKLSKLIADCLSLHPKDRPESFAEVLERLPRRAHNRATGATEPTDLLATATAPLSTPTPNGRARRWPWLLAGGLVLLGIVAGAWWLLPGGKESPPADNQPSRADTRPGTVANEPIVSAPTDTFRPGILPEEQAFNAAELDSRTALSRADYAAAWAAYEAFLKRHPKAASAAAAQVKQREVQSRVAELRQAAWRKAREAADKALLEKRTADALAALDRFPQELTVPLWSGEDIDEARQLETLRQVAVAAEESDLADLFSKADMLRAEWAQAQRDGLAESRRLSAAENLLRERDLLEAFLAGRTAGALEKVNRRLSELRKQLESVHQQALLPTQAFRQFCATRADWAAQAARVATDILPLLAERNFEAARARVDELAVSIARARESVAAPGPVAARIRERREVEDALAALREDIVVADKCALAVQGALRRIRLNSLSATYKLHTGYDADGKRSGKLESYTGKVMAVTAKEFELQTDTARLSLKIDLLTIDGVRDLVKQSQNVEEQLSLVAWLVALGRQDAAIAEEARIARMPTLTTDTGQRLREMAATGRLAAAAQRRMAYMAVLGERAPEAGFETTWGGQMPESRLLRARAALANGGKAAAADYVALAREVADPELIHLPSLAAALSTADSPASDLRLRVTLEPWDAEAHAVLAAVLAREGNLSDARLEAQRALILDAGHEAAYAIVKSASGR